MNDAKETDSVDELGKDGSEEAAKERTPQNITVTDIAWEQLENERDEYKDKFFRQLAEGENMRKRLQKEKLDYAQFAVQKVLVDFLGPIDHMESALQYAGNMSPEVRNWAVGFEMILNQFKQVLTNQGVSPIEVKGEFDPHCHEVFELVESDEHAPGAIITTNRPGYKIGDRTIRAARVTVAKAKEAAAEQGSAE
jgi:molecular chaperone GrpE